MTDIIRKPIAEYEKVFNALDVEKQVPFFAESMKLRKILISSNT